MSEGRSVEFRASVVALALGAVAAAVAALWPALRERTGDSSPAHERVVPGAAPKVGSSRAPTIARARAREGSPADRGTTSVYGFDVDELRTRPGLEPVVQYLTYIQSRRGDRSHLMFVRYDDLDAMAQIEGEPVPAFLERLDQLGVVVSTN